MLSGLNSPDREDYVFADRGNYAQKFNKPFNIF